MANAIGCFYVIKLTDKLEFINTANLMELKTYMVL